MSNNEIRELYDKLENEYLDGGYVSRASIFLRALADGKITEDICKQAREYYGSLWNYVGD